jgi:tetratricopeptide (TPR) repeat protein
MQLRIPALALVVLAPLQAASAAPRKVVRDAPALTDAEKVAHKTMAAALRRGRALAGKNQHAEAVAAFDAALAAVPDEPHVLLELGVELRATGDLARAEAVCRKVALPGNDPTLRAPALFNLGRVLEDQKDRPGAIAAYRESLALRENPFVRERLLTLDPTAQGDATRPRPLEGPVATIAAWCDAHKDTPCRLDAGKLGVRLEHPSPPWLEARVFLVGDEGPKDCALAVRTARGWYVGTLEECQDQEFRHDVTATLAADDLLPDPGAELLVTLEGTDSMKDYDKELGHSVCCIDADFTAIAVCGVGPSGAPSCTPTLQLKPPLEPGGRAADVGLEPRFGADGLTLVRADGKAIDDAKVRLHGNLRALSGRHHVTFP